MPLWGSGSNHVVFTADATNNSYRLNNVTVGVGFTNTDIHLGQLVVSTGTTGIPYDSRIANIGLGATYIDLTNPYIAGTGTTISFDANDAYKPEKAIVGNKAFEGYNTFATQRGWVQRRYKKRIAFTGVVTSGSTTISNVVVGNGSTAADFQLGQLVGGIGVPGDPTDKKGNYITQLLPAAGSGVTGIVLSDVASLSGSNVALSAYNYWDEVIVSARELSSRIGEPEIQAVSFDRASYPVNTTGYVIMSFNEPVNVLGTGSTLIVNNSSTGNTTASYAYGSGTNRIHYSFGTGLTGTLSITSQTLAGAGATIAGLDQNYVSLSFPATLTTGSRVATGVTTTASLKVGQPIVSTGFTASTQIVSVSSGGTTITLSTSALSTGTTTVSISEANARTQIYSSYLVGAGMTSLSLSGAIPTYPGTSVFYYGGNTITAAVS